MPRVRAALACLPLPFPPARHQVGTAGTNPAQTPSGCLNAILVRSRCVSSVGDGRPKHSEGTLVRGERGHAHGQEILGSLRPATRGN